KMHDLSTDQSNFIRTIDTSFSSVEYSTEVNVKVSAMWDQSM
ncbi:hypothetical protein DBR06_SOUSAS3810105, partial [Sousa chinensis]